eukprot:CAMPEP_0179372304 /NCGR_PEP_ID=MMETSP0797-20121207/86188_1 /TAXON_ID=47934 /ORGANISM="Dinophysis acuminata, Strain DAEP01" /LENGTH=369 /DNA_ID=CAMNT_0021088215 /DNA_START=52 /DNA_END=1163 /DNA_ORIENTATION=+
MSCKADHSMPPAVEVKIVFKRANAAANAACKGVAVGSNQTVLTATHALQSRRGNRWLGSTPVTRTILGAPSWRGGCSEIPGGRPATPALDHEGRAGARGREAGVRRAQLLDAARVLAPHDPEEPRVAPGRAPAVRDGPVVGGVLRAVADDLHGVAALREELPEVLGVDARLVAHEALVDHEGDLDRPVGEDLLLHVLDAVDREDARGPGPDEGLAVGARGRAGRGRPLAGGVGEAGVGHDPGVLQVLPGLGELAPAAAHVALVAAHHVLRRQDGRGLPGGDGLAVAQHLRRGEGPAAAAPLLVPDWVDQAGPLLPRVEVGRHVGDGLVDALVPDLVHVLPDVREGRPEDHARLVEGQALEELVGARHPF